MQCKASTWKWLLLGLMMATSDAQPGQEYVDPRYGFRIMLPADWKPTTVEGADPSVLVQAFENKDETILLMVMYEAKPLLVAGRRTYGLVMNNFLTSMQEPDPDEKTLTVRELGRNLQKVNGLEVATLDLEYITNGIPLYYRARFIVADRGLYYLCMSMPKKEFTANEATINQIMDSFKPKDAASQQLPWGRILTVLGSICLCAGVGIAGTLFLILRLARKRQV